MAASISDPVGRDISFGYDADDSNERGFERGRPS
jgi:hypothetical protein